MGLILEPHGRGKYWEKVEKKIGRRRIMLYGLVPIPDPVSDILFIPILDPVIDILINLRELV